MAVITKFDDEPFDERRIDPEFIAAGVKGMPLNDEMRAMYARLPLPNDEEFELWKEEMLPIYERAKREFLDKLEKDRAAI